MYRNRNILSRVRHKLGRTLCLVILCSLVLGIAIIIRYYNKNSENNQQTVTRIVKFTKLMKNYMNYKLMGVKTATINVDLESFQFNDQLFTAYKWQDNSPETDSLCNALDRVLMGTMDPNNSPARHKKIWQIVEFSIKTICERISIPLPNNRVPWGHNWYAFSISIPRILVFATFLHRDQFNRPNREIEGWLRLLVPELLKTPKQSLGWIRDGPNAVMMAIPYLGANILLNRYDNAVGHADFKYVLKYIQINYVTSGEGFYADGGFVFHSNMRAYGYVYGSFVDFKLLADYYKFDSIAGKLEKIYNLLNNPSPKIRTQYGPWFSRTQNMSIGTKAYGTFGYNIIPSNSMISVRTVDFTLQFHGQKRYLGHYEADQANFNMLQYATMSRHYHYEDTDPILRLEFMTYYPGVISLNNKHIVLKTDPIFTTTQSFVPDDAQSILCQINDRTIGVYNTYNIRVLKFKVEEVILITDYGMTISYNVTQRGGNMGGIGNDTVFVSTNFGKLRNDITQDNSEKTTTKRVEFKNDSTICHTSGPTYLRKCTREEDNMDFYSFQMELDNNNCAAFSTYHTTVQPSIQNIATNVICENRYKLYYYKEHLFLIDVVDNVAAVGIGADGVHSIISFSAKTIKHELGAMCRIRGGEFSAASGIYKDITNNMRMYSLFTDVTANSNEDIMRRVGEATLKNK
ncbi:Occlusion-derived virus envelope protein E66 [Dolichomitus sp. PSUC_FEM 10030005]|nr:Occlusion-derived virus envelope protein E66 [Dolichomitus sp. PSUC_FEM 10030005]